MSWDVKFPGKNMKLKRKFIWKTNKNVLSIPIFSDIFPKKIEMHNIKKIGRDQVEKMELNFKEMTSFLKK